MRIGRNLSGEMIILCFHDETPAGDLYTGREAALIHYYKLRAGEAQSASSVIKSSPDHRK